MQKLDFNNEGKLVAYTDNGCTDGKSSTTEIDGTFEVSADVVKFILAKEILSHQLRINDLNYKLSIQKEEYKKLLDAIDEFNKS